jgi:hypothetical protein
MSNRTLARSAFAWSGVLAVLAAMAGCSHPTGTTAASPISTASSTAPSAAPVVTTPGGQCIASTVKGACGPYLDPAIYHSDGQDTFVGQDVWNAIPGWSQTLHVSSPGDWYAVADMPAGNTAVVSFPNVGEEYYYTNSLAGFSSIYSSFDESMHPTNGTSAEAAYDIWLNDWGNEVMIQHDIVNRGNCPIVATASFGGSGGVPVQGWNFCKYGSELIWQLAGKGEQSGTVNILAMLDWLVSHGYLPHKSGLTDISYGFEICSTAGRPETFTVSRFTISAG